MYIVHIDNENFVIIIIVAGCLTEIKMLLKLSVYSQSQPFLNYASSFSSFSFASNFCRESKHRLSHSFKIAPHIYNFAQSNCKSVENFELKANIVCMEYRAW